MKILKNILFITLIFVFATAFFACGNVAVTNDNNETVEEPVKYSVIFYAPDGSTIFDEQTVNDGEDFVLPIDNNGRTISGYYTWEGESWSADYVPLADFDKPDAKKVTHDLQFKAQYEWSGISR